jgi:hypothetical protein
MAKKDECQELKNIKYRGMLEHHNTNNMVNETTENMTNLDDFLEKEKQLNSNIPWAKLDKTIKIKKLNAYVDQYIQDNKLTVADNKSMNKYLKESLDKKLLNRVKDVIYDKETGNISSIPALSFNKVSRKFTLTRNEKRAGTSKSLAPKKPRKTRKVENKIIKDKIDINNKQ